MLWLYMGAHTALCALSDAAPNDRLVIQPTPPISDIALSRHTSPIIKTQTGAAMIMAVPKFRAGERASITASRMPSSAGGNYNIIRVLPASRGEPIRYQVKGDSERFERIVDEASSIA